MVDFDLKFEIYGVKYLVKFGGRTLPPARKPPKISGEFRGRFRQNFQKLRFEFRVFFFGNFVQQKDRYLRSVAERKFKTPKKKLKSFQKRLGKARAKKM